ncbi:MAG: hypothetical protein U9O87_00835 [Verrucomicrobiota bacterium]|nr:hypothetical protein [Verrucomicrobiota bacterium]
MSNPSCGYTRLLRKGHLTGLHDFQDRQDGVIGPLAVIFVFFYGKIFRVSIYLS